MSKTTAARPRQTTMAGVMVMLAAVFVVLAAFDRVARLRSLETRESLERVIDDLPGGFSPSVESVIRVSHVVAIVAALCAVAAVALGWQVLQGSRQARTILSVLAVPIFVTGLVAGGFMSSIVTVATLMLWLSPSREWFAGKPIPEPVKKESVTTDPVAKEQPAIGWPQPVAGPTPTKRPDPLTVAMVLTIVVAGFIPVSSPVTLVVLITQPDLMLDELRRTNPELEEQGASDRLLLGASYVSVGLMVAVSGLAVVLAVLMAKRRARAARLLLICSAACALFCIIAAIASPIALIPAAAAIATVNCLRRPEVRARLDAR
ncbi:hypothetical protein [Nocardioides sp. B-3]|uniref:hypothetical protein n=1 Tax=Nocardioides sp. B-3 TaxID=2895565 RepID=UPI0021524DB9|nr:hypothetical protein [Nocardioides sp. B-3]UUZ61501.1 hypothetical protein LP418_13625 [Nocardioides sp. B-3]